MEQVGQRSHRALGVNEAGVLRVGEHVTGEQQGLVNEHRPSCHREPASREVRVDEALSAVLRVLEGLARAAGDDRQVVRRITDGDLGPVDHSNRVRAEPLREGAEVLSEQVTMDDAARLIWRKRSPGEVERGAEAGHEGRRRRLGSSLQFLEALEDVGTAGPSRTRARSLDEEVHVVDLGGHPRDLVDRVEALSPEIEREPADEGLHQCGVGPAPRVGLGQQGERPGHADLEPG